MLRETAPAHQPNERDALARRQADAAVALLRLGYSDAVWPLLRLTPDPGTRTYLVHALGPSGIDPAILLRELEANRDPSVRRALILSLGHFTREQLPDSLRQPIVARLLRWYRDDPDPGVHASIDWLLRHGRQGTVGGA